MPQKVRVGFIGTGGIAGLQAKNLSDIEDVEIVAGCDISEEALAKFAEKYEVPQTFTDYNEMLQLDELDAVTVCTPNIAHKDPTIAALKAGKHTMVEKPMAMNAEEAQAMVDAGEQSEATLTMGFQYRLSPAAQTLKRFVDDGQIGGVMFARVQALRRLGIPNWGVFGRKELQGGGPLIDIGVHLIECAHFLMREPKPVAASARMFTYAGDKPCEVDCQWPDWDHETYTVEDLAVGFVRFDNGAVMSVESSFVAHIEENVFNVQIMGEKGGCTLHPPMVFKNEAGTMVNVEPAHMGKWHSMTKKIQDWIARIRGERETQCPAEAGLMVQKILDGLYRSAEEGKEIPID
ncbi:MAG: Gfo/Idh/MocA family oxidoreductase [Candidatus Brocadiia bacterium]